MDKIFLWAIALFNPLLSRAGVDTFQLNEILKTKLLLDERRPKATFGGRRGAATASGKARTPAGVIIANLIMGSLYGALLVVFKKPLVGQTVYFSIFMVMMMLTLITDFTSVLFDVRDQYIIAPRPVNDRTVAFARILHVTVYVLKLALLQGIPGLIIISIFDTPLAAPLLLLQIIEATMLSILLVNVIYLIMMQLVSPQRFKDIISYIQIGFSVTIFACYYLLPRLINMSVLANFDLLQHQFAYFIPPVWIASLNETLLHPLRATFLTTVMAAIGIVVPLAGIWFVAKVLAPGFNRRLSIIAMSDGPATPSVVKINKPGFMDRIANFIAPDPIENAGFRITWKLASRTREFKMKVYPLFAFVPVYFIYFALNTKGADLTERFYTLQHGKSYIFLNYLCILVLSAILQQISQSDKYKASWVYYALPIDKPGKVLAGMYKAILVLYFFPYCLILSIASIAIWGPAVVNDVLLAFTFCLTYGILIALFMVKGLPFSKPVLAKQSGGRVVTSMLITMFAGVFGFGHYLLAGMETVIWILIVPAALVYWIMFNYYRKQTWDAIELAEID